MKNITFKKNDIEKLLLNLDLNPESQKNKDFRYSVSLIYELIEEEFADTFDTKNPILRDTLIEFFKVNNDDFFFITPPYSFEYYLKSKGSLYRIKPSYRGDKLGYTIPLNLFFEYFTGIEENLNIEVSKEYEFYHSLIQFVKKTIEKLNFIPTVKMGKEAFTIIYEPYLNNKDYIACYKEMVENDFLDAQTTKDLIDKYLNYLIFAFLGIKAHKFNDLKSAPFFIKQSPNKRFVRSVDLAIDIQTWLDEMALGSYEIVPIFNIEENGEDKFLLRILAKSKKTNEIVPFDNLTEFEQTIIEKQLNWATKYIEDLEDITMELDLAGVYKLVTQVSYYLAQAGMEVNLPVGMNNIIVPRASINARIKQKRLDDAKALLDFSDNSTISLDELMDFSIEIALGEDEKISAEEFQELAKNSNGLIKYKDKYILIDKEETDKLLERLKKAPNLTMNKMKLLHYALSGKLENYDFDYDEAFAKIISDFTKVKDIELPKSLDGVLRPYQVIGYKWLYTNVTKGFGCCIADDMGLGKTVQVISLILKLKEENKLKKPALVVCPTTLLGNWEREFKIFAPSLNVFKYHGIERSFTTNCDVILTTYAITRIDLDEFKKHEWDVFVIDEAQNIKNPTTSQTQAIKAIKAKMKIAMTGTPVENRLNELWSIFDFVNKGYLGSITDFGKNYAIPIERFKETNRIDKLKKAISPFMLRRLKTDKTIISDLPEKIVLDEYCYLTKSQALLYEKVLNKSMDEIAGSKATINRRGAIFKLITCLKQVCNHPYHYLKSGDMSQNASGKTQKLISILNNIIENDEKVLIFTQYKQMGDILTKIVADEYDIDPLFFHGSLNIKSRDNMIKQFEEDKDKKVMILSLKAGGLGLNLTPASNVIHYDLWWNPAVEDQATDRTYRIGQDKNVMVHRFITLSTFEEKIDKIIKDKRDLADSTIFVGEKIITELSDDEIYDIFSLA
ncbi:MAG: DEAD/DEAH box helicase [Cyanobacteria bacterium SIG30]|nr:DEAD/DEAH box helicase [Cyanobacteria bacterium SIG30]